MNDDSGNRHPQRGWLLRLEALVLVALAAFLAWTGVRIAQEGSRQELHAADAIVVFGAAEYSGRPSPVLRARLIMPLIFFSWVAPVVITTGGAAADPSFSEGGVGRDYLEHRGIPERNLIAETQGSDTAQSAVRVAVIMRANGLRSCVAVSDHIMCFALRNCWSMKEWVRSMFRRGRIRVRTVWCSVGMRCCGRLAAICCGSWG